MKKFVNEGSLQGGDMRLVVRAPVRIDFAGGWTDIQPFANSEGGAVLNAAIDRYVEGQLEIRDADVKPKGMSADRILSQSSGISLSYGSDLPTGSGLGTSAAMNVVFLFLIRYELFKNEKLEVIAEAAFEMERLLRIKGGKQDQYASALGGINFMTFTDKVKVEKLHLESSIIKQLEKQLVLCYSGKSRLSGNIHDKVWGRYLKGETVDAFQGLKKVACRMKRELVKGNLGEFANLLSKNWEYQKKLDSSVTNSMTEKLFRTAFKNGAIGGKACGAGGGGCLLFFCDEGRVVSVKKSLALAGGRIIPFRFSKEGLTWEVTV
jgi:D-glycero-alpha-D-manno-heptose-7-phosphate kinase